MTPALPIYNATQLGPERAKLAAPLRERLWQAGSTWPRWIDARPGRLSAIVADCGDPPLGQLRQYLLSHHRGLLTEGLAALGLAVAAPRLVLAVPESAFSPQLSRELSGTSLELCRSPSLFPAQPTREVRNLTGVPWVVPAEKLVAAAAIVRGIAAPRLCSLAGALKKPGVLSVVAGETPRQLVQRAGGASVAAWMALSDDLLNGTLVPADKPLADGTTLLYILPARHTLIRRHKRALRERAQATCLSCRLCTDFCVESANGTAPHRIMQALARKELRHVDAAFAAGCTACGACSASCPADLLPGSLVSALAAAQLPKHNLDEPPPAASPSRLPQELVLRRLDLMRYVP